MKKRAAYSLSEESVNTVTHAIGLSMALAVCTFFFVKSGGADSWLLPSALLYICSEW